MFGILECRPGSPVRPPAWRWLLADLCIEKQYVFGRGRLDTWTARTIRMRRIMRKTKDEAHAIRKIIDVEGDFGYDMLDAYSIQRQPDSPTGTEIEARLLAGQSFTEIGKICGIAPPIVEAYEAMFFNVTDRLKNASWVANCVLGKDFHEGLSERDWRSLWRLYGYFGGPAVFTAIQMRHQLKDSPDDEQVEAQLRADRRRSLLLKENMAARTMQVNGFTQVPIMEMGLRNAELEHKLATGNTDEIANSLEQLMRSFCLKVLDNVEQRRAFEPRTVGLLPEAPTVEWNDSPFEMAAIAAKPTEETAKS